MRRVFFYFSIDNQKISTVKYDNFAHCTNLTFSVRFGPNDGLELSFHVIEIEYVISCFFPGIPNLLIIDRFAKLPALDLSNLWYHEKVMNNDMIFISSFVILFDNFEYLVSSIAPKSFYFKFSK